jgi:multiple sugar transport system permease protein
VAATLVIDAPATADRGSIPGRRRRPRRAKPSSLARIPLYLLGVPMLVPFYWMITGAFRPARELTGLRASLVPHETTTGNFVSGGAVPGLFQQFPTISLGFWRLFINSMLITSAVTVGALLLASLAAYAITKTKLPGRKVFFVIVLASMMIPWQVALIPNFLIVRDLGWLNTYQAYIVPSLPKAFVVFFLVQYMRSIPDELSEAARIDGAGDWRTWWSVILPLLRPALAAMAIFVALGEWNNFLWPLIVAQSDAMANLPVGLARLGFDLNLSPQTVGVVMAGSLITTIPTVTFFFLFQKHFTTGITLTGLKG